METNFWDVVCLLGTFCLMVLVGIGGEIEVSSAASEATRRATVKRTEKTPASENGSVGLADEANIVRSLIIKGNNSFSEQQIHALMQTDVWSVYDAAVLESDFEAITDFYKRNGYRFARIIVAQNYVKKFEDGIYLGFEIDEGIIGNITVSGNTQTREHVVLRELLFQEGDVYIEADKSESERILRRKAYIGSANIEPQWNASSESVTIHVTITDLWSLTGAFDPLPAINPEGGRFLLAGEDFNFLGYGHFTQFSYVGEIEKAEKTQHFIHSRYQIPRLFNSYWSFDGEFTQRLEGNAWTSFLERPQYVFLLKRPQYSLKSRWSASLLVSEQIHRKRWYEKGIKTDIFERNLQTAHSSISRYFGDRHRQNYVGLWAESIRSRHERIETFGESEAAPSDRDIKSVGITVGRKRVAYHKTRFLRKMGQEEDFETGSHYAFAIGYASPLYGSDRSESHARFTGKSAWIRGDHLLSTAVINLSTNFTTRIERSKVKLQTSWYYIDVFDAGNNIYTVDKGYRKNGFFDFHQTVVAQFATEMQFGWSGEDQVNLGSDSGLRGYDPQQFDGEKMMLARIESRTLCGGMLFSKIDDGLSAVVTFILKPFIKHPVKVGLVLSATVFADIGYIWNGKRSFNLGDPKSSVGFGLRGSFSRVSGPSIFRLGLAFPLNLPFAAGIEPRLFYGFNQTF